MSDLKYPVGKFEIKPGATHEQREALIESIAQTPARLCAAIANLSAKQLDEPYRPGGWTVRQVVHHLPDSHMNAYTRFKLALTEEAPVVRPLLEDRWAELPDGKTAPVEISLALLERIHARWVLTLGAITPEEW